MIGKQTNILLLIPAGGSGPIAVFVGNRDVPGSDCMYSPIEIKRLVILFHYIQELLVHVVVKQSKKTEGVAYQSKDN